MADNKTNGQNGQNKGATKKELNVNEKALVRLAIAQLTDKHYNSLGTRDFNHNPTWNEYTTALVQVGVDKQKRFQLMDITNEALPKLNKLSDEALEFLAPYMDTSNVKLDDKEGILIGIANVFEKWFKESFPHVKRQRFKHDTLVAIDIIDYLGNKKKNFPKAFTDNIRGESRREKIASYPIDSLKSVYNEMVA